MAMGILKRLPTGWQRTVNGAGKSGIRGTVEVQVAENLDDIAELASEHGAKTIVDSFNDGFALTTGDRAKVGLLKGGEKGAARKEAMKHVLADPANRSPILAALVETHRDVDKALDAYHAEYLA